MEQTTTIHTPVLLQQVIDVLSVNPGDTVLDCTLGGGGHAEALLPLLGPKGLYIGVDADETALARVYDRLGADARLRMFEGNFRDLTALLEVGGVEKVDRVLFDLGLSSDQYLGASARGFSFTTDEPLLMTLSATPSEDMITADTVVNEWSEESLADIIYGFGGETRARKIARMIVDERTLAPIETSSALADVAVRAYGKYHGRTHPATKTFQAIRMAVNDELGALKEGLSQALSVVEAGGRIAVISFHSLEDRTVKYTFREWSEKGFGTIVTKKPIAPDRAEILQNPRARSAKLRCFEKKGMSTMT